MMQDPLRLDKSNKKLGGITTDRYMRRGSTIYKQYTVKGSKVCTTVGG